MIVLINLAFIQDKSDPPPEGRLPDATKGLFKLKTEGNHYNFVIMFQVDFLIFFYRFRFRPFKGCLWPYGSQWQRYCCPIRWSHFGLFKEHGISLLVSFMIVAHFVRFKWIIVLFYLLMFIIGFWIYIYREGATRSVLDLRDPGPPTLLFSTTPISSKIHSAPDMFFIDIILSRIQVILHDFSIL
jgi:hypothetical protein